jgi:hypothetical protein
MTDFARFVPYSDLAKETGKSLFLLQDQKGRRMAVNVAAGV